ncbi:MAG: polysaccharide deacetylase family protein [Candidatus Cloacimonadaceae bacterium]
MKRLLFILFSTLLLLSCRFSTQAPKTDLVVCFNFDDHCLSVYENALPIMNQYGFRATVFANTGRVGRPNKMTWAMLDSLKHFYNWEIGGHTLNHEMLSQLTYEQAEYTIATDFNNLDSHGYAPKSFATTFGYCPAEYYDLINTYYRNIRTCFNSPMYCPIERTMVGSYNVTNEMSAREIVNRVTQAMVDKENLVVFLFHEIDTVNTDYNNNCHPLVFAEAMQRLSKMGVKVLPLDEALNYLSD